MKLEIEINIADDAADKLELQEHLRKEAILTLFGERRFTSGQAARELGMDRLSFMELLQQHGIPCVIYTADDWQADAIGRRRIREQAQSQLRFWPFPIAVLWYTSLPWVISSSCINFSGKLRFRARFAKK